MADDLRASKGGSKLEDSAQLKKMTETYGAVNDNDVLLKSVIERFKTLEEQQRTIHEETIYDGSSIHSSFKIVY